jgi:hypothetical protein
LLSRLTYHVVNIGARSEAAEVTRVSMPMISNLACLQAEVVDGISNDDYSCFAITYARLIGAIRYLVGFYCLPRRSL